jgi:hypothetical protein
VSLLFGFSSALRQSLLSLQAQHAAERAANPDGHIARMKSMINLGSEFYVKAVVSVEETTHTRVDVWIDGARFCMCSLCLLTFALALVVSLIQS